MEMLVYGGFTYKEGTGHQDNNATTGGLGIEGCDLVADLLERQTLFDCPILAPLYRWICYIWALMGKTNRQLLSDGISTLDGVILKGEH